MTAIDILRAMLDERGVEYYASPNGVAWGKLATPIHGRMYTHYAVELDGLLCVDSHCITPEQAIAATLGDGEYERKMDALLCRLTNGKFSKTRAYDLDFMESVVREEFETDAATLEAETCFPALNSERDGIPYLDPWFVCSECGCQLTESRLGRIWQNYCPNCGRRIRIRRIDGE